MRISKHDARERLRGTGLKATAPRVAVLQSLVASPKPLSHSEVISEVGSEEWDQATVYRNLQRLVEVGLARVANRMGGITRYESVDDGETEHRHPHFSCRACGEMKCLPGARVGGDVAVGWQQSVQESELELVGDCPSCRAKQQEAGDDAGAEGR